MTIISFPLASMNSMHREEEAAGECGIRVSCGAGITGERQSPGLPSCSSVAHY